MFGLAAIVLRSVSIRARTAFSSAASPELAEYISIACKRFELCTGMVFSLWPSRSRALSRRAAGVSVELSVEYMDMPVNLKVYWGGNVQLPEV